MQYVRCLGLAIRHLGLIGTRHLIRRQGSTLVPPAIPGACPTVTYSKVRVIPMDVTEFVPQTADVDDPATCKKGISTLCTLHRHGHPTKPEASANMCEIILPLADMRSTRALVSTKCARWLVASCSSKPSTDFACGHAMIAALLIKQSM